MSQRRRSSKKPDYFFVVMTFTLGLWFVVFTVVIVTRLVGPIELPQVSAEVEQPTVPNPFGGGQFASPTIADAMPFATLAVQDYTQVVFGLPSDTVFRAEITNSENPQTATTEERFSQSRPNAPNTNSNFDTSASSVVDAGLESAASDVNIGSANVTSDALTNTLAPVQVNIPETVLPVAAETLSSMLGDTPEGLPQLEDVSPLEGLDRESENTNQQDVDIGLLELFPDTAPSLADASSQQGADTAQIQDTSPPQDDALLTDTPTLTDTPMNAGQLTPMNVDADTNRDALADLDLTNLEGRAITAAPNEHLDVSEENLVDSFVAASRLSTEQSESAAITSGNATVDATEAPSAAKLEVAVTPNVDTNMQPPVLPSVSEPDLQAVTSPEIDSPNQADAPNALPQLTSPEEAVDARAAAFAASPNPDEMAAIPDAQTQPTSPTVVENDSSTEIDQSSVTFAQTELTSPPSDNTIRVSPPPLLPTELVPETPYKLPPAPGVTVTNTGTNTSQTATSSASAASVGTVVITFVSDPVGAQVITEAGVLGTTPLALELPVGSELSYTLAVPEVRLGSSFRRFSSVLQATEDSTVSVWLDRIAGPPRPVEGFGTTRLVGTPAASPEAVKQLRETLQDMLARSRTEYQNALEEVQLGALEAEIDALENELARLDALAGEDHWQSAD